MDGESKPKSDDDGGGGAAADFSVSLAEGSASSVMKTPTLAGTAGNGVASPYQGNVVKPLTPIGFSYRIDDYTPPSVKSSHDLKASFRWESMLNDTGFMAAPVAAFRHVSLIVRHRYRPSRPHWVQHFTNPGHGADLYRGFMKYIENWI